LSGFIPSIFAVAAEKPRAFLASGSQAKWAGGADVLCSGTTFFRPPASAIVQDSRGPAEPERTISPERPGILPAEAGCIFNFRT